MSRLVKYLTLWALVCAAPPLGGWFSAGRAEAHSIFIFAYPENSRICTNSYFGGKAKVRGGLVSMATASGEVLAKAQTDERGQACFEPPALREDLIFKVEAGGGHQAEFRLPASGPGTGDSFESEPEPNKTEAGESPSVCAGGLTSDDLQRALSPIRLKLAEMESHQKSRVNLKDVVGGLGWIIGLAGAAFWAAGRKNP
jgi:nickel transport protein